MISELLAVGAENAKTGKELCDLLNITHRELSFAISRERLAGVPICSSSGRQPGYFLAADRSEMERFCRSLKHRAREITRTRKACTATLDKLPAGRGIQ